MRQGQQNRRGRGRSNSNNSNSNNGRKPQNPLTRNFESSGPDVKIRGTAAQIAEKYSALARDAHSSGDIVMAENYLQHAEHYNRIIMAAQQAQISASAQPSAHGHGHSHGQENGHALNGPQRIVSEYPNGAMHEQPQPEINLSAKPSASRPVKEHAPELPVSADVQLVTPSAAANDDGDAAPIHAVAQPQPDGEAEKPRRRRRYGTTGTGRSAKSSTANGKDLANGAADGVNGDHSADKAII